MGSIGVIEIEVVLFLMKLPGRSAQLSALVKEGEGAVS